MSQKGCLIISDVSGYTAFLTQAELEHANDILESLFHTLLEHTRQPLIVSKLEGDAIFSYALAGSFLQGQTLVEMIENIYCEFSRARETMKLNTTCTCKACSLIPTLDLKFVVHYGEFILGKMGGREELSGPDVIAVHRLLKNTVKEDTGVDAYALFTEACADAMKLTDMCMDMKPHTENYEHLGDVPGYIYDLRAVWERERERRHITVPRDGAWVVQETDVPVSPELAWDYVTDPDLKQKWMGVHALTATKLKNGRVGVGAQHHCAHGMGITTFNILDWRPFEYLTMEAAMPTGAVERTTTYLTPIEGGTRITWVVSKPIGRNALHSKLATVLLKKMWAINYLKCAANIPKMIRADLDSGRIVPGIQVGPTIDLNLARA
jgi:uncharacterized protein YndB with AHSA1/START domain